MAQTLRSRWLAVLVHAGLWLILILALLGVGGRAPLFREADGTLPTPQSPAAIAKLDRVFSPEPWPDVRPPTNMPNVFFTRHFVPTPAPKPPPPTTKQIELMYLGFYAANGGAKQVLVRMGDSFVSAAIGNKLTANLYASQAGMLSLLLTNSSGQTNLLPLNVKKQVEVPIK